MFNVLRMILSIPMFEWVWKIWYCMIRLKNIRIVKYIQNIQTSHNIKWQKYDLNLGSLYLDVVLEENTNGPLLMSSPVMILTISGNRPLIVCMQEIGSLLHKLIKWAYYIIILQCFPVSLCSIILLLST